MKILILGLTSSGLGGMESHNLGNYAIMEPLIVHLKEHFPGAQISTSIQMSEGFCQRFCIKSLHDRRFWTYGLATGFATIKDLMIAFSWKVGRNIFHHDFLWIIERSKLLNEIYTSDLIIDFSGDIYGDNARNLNFLEDNAEIIMSKMLGKSVVMFIGSPGPFSSAWRRHLARIVLNHIDMITNRDPISTEILKEIGVTDTPIYTTACPAFLFEKGNNRGLNEILHKEGLIPMEKPIIGIIICGWNMAESPFYKLPRKEYELRPFVDLIDHILDHHDVNILLMSHQNRTDQEGNLIRGNDHAIIEQIMGMIHQERSDSDRIITLDGLYDASTSKAIIGVCDMMISGRIHGAVAALSQNIPTVIIDYGHEPKAHKLRGFAQLVGVEEYICNPASSKDMIEKFESCWKNHDAIKSYLDIRIPKVKDRAMKNFNILKRLMNKKNISAIEYNKLENVNRLNEDMEHFLGNIRSDTLFIERIYPLVKENIKSHDSSVLDVGCGSGVLVDKLIKENISQCVYGCDFSYEKIEKCKKIHKLENFFVHDIYIPFDSCYDVIICTEVLEHLEHPEMAIKNLLSTLKANGKLIVSVPDGIKDTFSGHIHFWTPKNFQVFIKKCVNQNMDSNYDISFDYIADKNICIIKNKTPQKQELSQ